MVKEVRIPTSYLVKSPVFNYSCKIPYLLDFSELFMIHILTSERHHLMSNTNTTVTEFEFFSNVVPNVVPAELQLYG